MRFSPVPGAGDTIYLLYTAFCVKTFYNYELMKEGFQYQRIVWLHNRMKKGGVSRDEYREEFELSSRTFSRDIAMLSDRFYAPVVFENGKYTYSDKTFDLPQMVVTREELVALYNAMPLIEEFQGTPVYETVSKIVHAVGRNERGAEDFEGTTISRLNRKEISLDWEVFSVIAEGIKRNKSLSMEYHSVNSGGVSLREVDPLHVYVYENEFYLAGYCHVREEVRDFNLQRVKQLALTEKSFQVPESFSLRDYLGSNRWGIIKSGEIVEVTVRIRADRVYEITEDFPSRFTPLPEVRSEVSEGWSFFQLETDITNEFINWVLSKHGDVVIEEPESVRARVKEVCEGIMEGYGGK